MRAAEFLSHSPEETQAVAEKLAKSLKPGVIVCLFGELGAGKTTFVQGLAKGLKIKKSETVQSPTFVIMNIYYGKVPIYHFDLYRLKDARQISLIGYEEFLYGDGVAVIEWPENLGSLMPEKYLAVHLQHKGENSRLIQVKICGF